MSRFTLNMGSALSTVTLVVAAAAIWILAHPYEGIRHDGELYLAQALLHLNPEVFSKDLFFAYGSQDRFTLFSRLYAWAIDSFGVNFAAQAFLVVAQLSFACLSAVLLRRLLDGTLFWLGLALVFSYSPFYGGWSTFSYGEPFVTARSFAEPLGILALILLVDGRPNWSLAVIALAALLHPLIAITAACFWWVYQALRDPRWWLLALAAFAWPILAAFDFQLIESYWQRYDDQWWELVADRNGFVLLARWMSMDRMNLAADSLVVLFAIIQASDRRRRFLVAALITGMFGVAAAIVGADLMRNVLLTSLQLWRTHWILHLIAVGMLPSVVYELWKAPGTGRATAALIVTAFVSTRYLGSSGAMLLALGIQLGARRGFQLSALAEKMLLIACGLTSAVAIAMQLDLRLFTSAEELTLQLFETGRRLTVDLTGWQLAGRAISYSLMTILMMLGLLRALENSRLRPLAAICALAFGALGIGVWDQSIPWRKFVQAAGAVGDRPFAGLIGPDQQVLWRGEVLATWLLLSRPSWYSFTQGPGVLFNRDTALEFDRRRSIVTALEVQEETCMIMAGVFGEAGECSPDLEVLQTTCREAGSLDFIIMQSALKGSATAEWTFTDPRLRRTATYHLYDCKRLIGG